jgi:uncharacterized DUF497 family protein
MPNWRNPEFDWDDGNVEHIEQRHDVLPEEAEEVFLGRILVERTGDNYQVLGRDGNGRFLSLICIERNSKIRVISARTMTQTERRRYERH